MEHSDSDGDDEFYDRTGDVQRKRIEKNVGQEEEAALTYDELVQYSI